MHTPLGADPPPEADPPGYRPPWTQTLLKAESPEGRPLDAHPPGHVTCDACWEAPCEQNDRQV